MLVETLVQIDDGAKSVAYAKIRVSLDYASHLTRTQDLIKVTSGTSVAAVLRQVAKY